MPEPLPEYTWKITLRGKSKPLSVVAAYVQEGVAPTTATSVQAAAASRSNPPVVLKDAEHHAVFLAPADQVATVVRGRCVKASARMIPLPAGLEATPGQLREMQDALNAAAPGYPAKLILLPAGSEVSHAMAEAGSRAALKRSTRNGGRQ